MLGTCKNTGQFTVISFVMRSGVCRDFLPGVLYLTEVYLFGCSLVLCRYSICYFIPQSAVAITMN